MVPFPLFFMSALLKYLQNVLVVHLIVGEKVVF